jgi:hypothetical protein
VGFSASLFTSFLALSPTSQKHPKRTESAKVCRLCCNPSQIEISAYADEALRFFAPQIKIGAPRIQRSEISYIAFS